MAVKKIAISVPEKVLEDVDRLAQKTKTTRSGFITRVLKEVSRVNTQIEITRQINRIFDDKSVQEDQLLSAEFFLRAAEPDWEPDE